ncbi:MAG: indolepyruvate oxidoreductase subunit beta [Thermodesulfobacteriota bacterium]
MSGGGPLNLIIAGVGGQGNVLLSQVLGRALIARGYDVVVGETFGLTQRGGSVQSHIRVSKERAYGPLIPEGGAHVILGLEPLETLRLLPRYGRPDIRIIVNSHPVPPLNVLAGEARYPEQNEIKTTLEQFAAKVWWVNATAAARNLGAAVMANMVMLGCLISARLTPLKEDDLEKALAETLPADKLEQNLEAFRKGIRLIRKLK